MVTSMVTFPSGARTTAPRASHHSHRLAGPPPRDAGTALAAADTSPADSAAITTRLAPQACLRVVARVARLRHFPDAAWQPLMARSRLLVLPGPTPLRAAPTATSGARLAILDG